MEDVDVHLLVVIIVIINLCILIVKRIDTKCIPALYKIIIIINYIK